MTPSKTNRQKIKEYGFQWEFRKHNFNDRYVRIEHKHDKTIYGCFSGTDSAINSAISGFLIGWSCAQSSRASDAVRQAQLMRMILSGDAVVDDAGQWLLEIKETDLVLPDKVSLASEGAEIELCGKSYLVVSVSQTIHPWKTWSFYAQLYAIKPFSKK
jgi:hypothetical protein